MTQTTGKRLNGPTIQFRNVGLALGGAVILRGVDMTVESGAIHCLIGPNGGGKTSLIRCMLGRMPHSGEIRMCGPTGTVTGYVPQKLQFDDTLPMTVRDFMAITSQRRPAFFGLTRRREPDVHGVLERVGMIQRMDRPFGALSGGERQRVLLAQALLPEPDLLILDEPATGLDAEGSDVLHIIMQEMADRGATVLVIHHDLAAVRDVANEVTAINREVQFSGDPRNVLTSERMFNLFSAAKVA